MISQPFLIINQTPSGWDSCRWFDDRVQASDYFDRLKSRKAPWIAMFQANAATADMMTNSMELDHRFHGMKMIDEYGARLVQSTMLTKRLTPQPPRC